MYAQSLIEILPGFSVSTFTSQQLSRWNLLQNESPDDTLYVMNPIDFTRMDSLGRFKMALPGGCPAVLCNATKRVSYPNGDYVVMADVLENDDPDGVCSTGDLSVVRHNGTAVGMIRVDDRAFEIRDLKDGKWCLRTVKNSTLPEHCISSGRGGGTLHDDHDNGQLETRNTFCVIQVLVLFDTPSNVMGDIRARAVEDINKTNQALRNSGVFNENIRFELLDALEFNLANPQPLQILLDLARLRDANQALRGNLGADIVVYYSSVDYLAVLDQEVFDIFGAALGLELPGRQVIPERDAFVLVEATDIAKRRLTFQHELAHLMQCRHQEQNDFNGEFQHGHRFWYRRGVFGWGRGAGHTIMHTIDIDENGREEVRFLHYSNPAIEYRGAATGVAGIRDNARQIRNVGCNVANWRTGTELSVFIEGPVSGCPFQSANLKAYITSNAPTPYTYTWEISTTSFMGPFSPIGVSNPNIYIPLGDVGETVYVRLTITAANGMTTTAFHEVRPEFAGDCYEYFFSTPSGQTAQDAPVSIHLWPNPARERINTALKVESPQEYIYADLLSSDGVILQSQQWKAVQVGTIYTWFQSTTLPPGIYRLRIVTPQGVVSNPVVKH